MMEEPAMRVTRPWIPVAFAVLLVAGCSSQTPGTTTAGGSTPGTAATAIPTNVEPSAQGGGGGGNATPVAGSGQIPAISDRTFTGGTAHVRVTGSFAIDKDLPLTLNGVSWVSADIGSTHLWFGTPPTTANLHNESDNVEMTFDNAAGSVITPATGPWSALAGSDGCTTFSVQVTPTLVSGQISCKGVAAGDSVAGTTGSVDIEITFSATS
jgi:hypothetical protein